MSEFVPFADVFDYVERFRALLASRGVAVAPGSPLDIACDASAAILLRHWDRSLLGPLLDIREDFRDALAVYTFARKVLKQQGHPDFNELLPHLMKLATKGGIEQNQWSDVRDQLSPKIFELLIALAAMDSGTMIRLDDPDKSKGDNPDVIVTIDGVRWGFACKMLNTAGPEGAPNPKTLFDNIEKAVRQIEAAPDVQVGLVIISLKNVIRHDRLWPILNPDEVANGAEPIFGAAILQEPVVQCLRKRGTALFDEMEKVIGADEVLAIFRGRKASPGAAFYIQTVASIVRGGTPFPTHLLFLQPETDKVATAVCNRLNAALQDQI